MTSVMRCGCTAVHFRPCAGRLLPAVTIFPTPISAAMLRSLKGCSGQCWIISKSFLRDLPQDDRGKGLARRFRRVIHVVDSSTIALIAFLHRLGAAPSAESRRQAPCAAGLA